MSTSNATPNPALSPAEVSRLCGCSFIRPHQSVMQGLEGVRRLGFSWVDVGVGGANGHFDPIEVAQSPLVFADEVRRAAYPDLRLNECFTLNFGPPLNTPDLTLRRQTRELFERLCRFAQAAGFRSVLLLPGPVHESLGLARSLDLAVAACTELVAIAQEYVLALNIEADCASCAHTPEAADELCRRVPGLGLTLDYSHFICQGIASERIACLHQHMRHLHIRQAAPGHIVTGVDAGTIDYDALVQQLETTGYGGLYCIEYLSLTDDERVHAQSENRTRAMSREIEHYLQNTNIDTNLYEHAPAS